MSTSIKILKKSDPAALQLLQTIFSPTNVISCAAYGGGDHCNDERTQKKFDLWGARGDDASSPLKCYLISVNDKPAAMINLGVTGNPPTVIDRKHDNGKVLELSGLMVRDEHLKHSRTGEKYWVNKEVAHAAAKALAEHEAPGYTKAFATFRDAHPYQGHFYTLTGATKLTAKSAENILGANAFHPERFKFVDNHLQECSRWDDAQPKISHDGWHDSAPCVAWDSVNGVVFNINSAGDILHSTEEL